MLIRKCGNLEKELGEKREEERRPEPRLSGEEADGGEGAVGRLVVVCLSWKRQGSIVSVRGR